MNEIIQPIQIACDMDGVLLHFEYGVQKLLPNFVDNSSDKKMKGKMWKHITMHQKNGGLFWEELPLMPDAMILWDYIKPYNPEILTACGQKHFNAGAQKLVSVAKHFGDHVKVNLVEHAKDKAKFVKPGAILIDDRMKAIQPWTDAGGIGVLHTSASDTIEQLKKLGL